MLLRIHKNDLKFMSEKQINTIEELSKQFDLRITIDIYSTPEKQKSKMISWFIGLGNGSEQFCYYENLEIKDRVSLKNEFTFRYFRDIVLLYLKNNKLN
jgi:hypothetical protein